MASWTQGIRGDTPRIEGYDDLQLIGRGGYSTVWLAHQGRFDRLVALKVIDTGASGIDAEAFLREQRLTGRLDGHPNIIRVFESGETARHESWLAMEYLEAGTYADSVRRRGPLSVAEALAVGVKLAGALAAAHEAQILHRDIKPQNVLRSPFVGPVLADFGIAGLSGDGRDGAGPGAFSILHAAPEVLGGAPASERSDCWSVVSTVYELLAGRAPFHDPDAPGLIALLHRATTSNPPPIGRPDLPPPAEGALLGLLARDPDERVTRAEDLAAGLQEVEALVGLEPTMLPVAGAARSPVHRADVSSAPGFVPVRVEGLAPPPGAVRPDSPDTLTPPRSEPRRLPGPDLDHAAPQPVGRRPGSPSTSRSGGHRRGIWAAVAVGLAVCLVLGAGILASDAGGAGREEASPPVCPAVGDVAAGLEPPADDPSPPSAVAIDQTVAGLVVRWRSGADAPAVVYLRCRPGPAAEPVLTEVAAAPGTDRDLRVPDLPPGHEVCVTVGLLKRAGGTALAREPSMPCVVTRA